MLPHPQPDDGTGPTQTDAPSRWHLRDGAILHLGRSGGLGDHATRGTATVGHPEVPPHRRMPRPGGISGTGRSFTSVGRVDLVTTRLAGRPRSGTPRCPHTDGCPVPVASPGRGDPSPRSVGWTW